MLKVKIQTVSSRKTKAVDLLCIFLYEIKMIKSFEDSYEYSTCLCYKGTMSGK